MSEQISRILDLRRMPREMDGRLEVRTDEWTDGQSYCVKAVSLAESNCDAYFPFTPGDGRTNQPYS